VGRRWFQRRGSGCGGSWHGFLQGYAGNLALAAWRCTPRLAFELAMFALSVESVFPATGKAFRVWQACRGG
jgi:hypothetical protein